jgi:glycosyltransferase involved in cell wall biosynthesis
VLYNYWAKWATKYDEEIKARFQNVEWIETGGNPEKSAVYYFFTRIRHKLYRLLHRFFPENLYLATHTEIRGFDALLFHARRIKADLYVAHNLGALPVAANAAAKHKSQYAFDAEDFHRGQVEEKTEGHERTVKLENAFLPKASYITAASPLIAEMYAVLYKKDITVLNNVFPRLYQPDFKELPFDKLRLIWFSQTIGVNRGLQDVLKAVNEIHEKKIHITLIGLYSKEIERELRQQLTNRQHSLQFVEPVHEIDLLELCSQHHIGLALERREPFNRDICLTNKIFSYLIAGSAIIASDTKAQKQFFEQHAGVGYIYEVNNCKVLTKILLDLIDDPVSLTKARKEAYQLAKQKLNWDCEKEKLLPLIEEALY